MERNKGVERGEGEGERERKRDAKNYVFMA